MDKITESQTLAEATQLVQEYQQILRDVTRLSTLGAPETLLPASKDELRQALCVVARAISTDTLADPMAMDELRTSYLSLSNFLSYEEANAAVRLQAAFDRGDRSYLASNAASQTVARAQRIEQEAGLLAIEFDALLKHNASGGLLLEIDSLLVELDRKFLPATNG